MIPATARQQPPERTHALVCIAQRASQSLPARLTGRVRLPVCPQRHSGSDLLGLRLLQNAPEPPVPEPSSTIRPLEGCERSSNSSWLARLHDVRPTASLAACDLTPCTERTACGTARVAYSQRWLRLK